LFKWQRWYSLPSIIRLRKFHRQHQCTSQLVWGHGVLLVCIVYSDLYSEIVLTRKPFEIGHMYIYSFLLRMTDTMTARISLYNEWRIIWKRRSWHINYESGVAKRNDCFCHVIVFFTFVIYLCRPYAVGSLMCLYRPYAVGSLSVFVPPLCCGKSQCVCTAPLLWDVSVCWCPPMLWEVSVCLCRACAVGSLNVFMPSL
jgi:hypothetical protein